jgi:hypothetical protein
MNEQMKGKSLAEDTGFVIENRSLDELTSPRAVLEQDKES